MLLGLEASRKLWNDALVHRKMRWESERKSTSYNHQASILTSERNRGLSVCSLYSQAGQDVLRRLDKAFRLFFTGRAGYPKFKKFSQSGSFTYPQAYNGSVRIDTMRKRLFLSKIGNVRAVLHRPLPKDSRVKTCTVIREADGRWFASLVIEEVVPLQNIEFSTPSARTPIGVDLGLLSLITTSDGNKIEHPHFLKKAEKKLKNLQQVFARKKKGSKNNFKARKRVASQQAKVRRQRLDFNYKLSSHLAKEHSFIAFENLRVKNMVKNHKLAKAISDASWNQLVRLTEQKARSTGSKVVRVPAAYSTQECFHCGTLNQLDLSVREFVCIGCGRLLVRDYNAANVVLKRGLALAGLAAPKVGQDMPELKPVEAEPLIFQTTGRPSSAIDAGTKRAEIRAESSGERPGWMSLSPTRRDFEE